MAAKNKKVYDTIIVGAGIMGSATAYYLCKEYGKSVLLLDQFEFLHKFGSSHGESRLIRSTYTEEHYTFLMKDAYKFWDEVEAEHGSKIHTKIGGLNIAKADNPEFQCAIRSAAKYNVPLELLSSEEVSSRFPAVKLPEGYIAAYSPDGGILKPTKAVAMFQKLAAKYGCQLKDNIRVVNIEDNDHDIKVHCSTDTFVTRKLILTAGAWTSKFYPDLKLPLKPIQTVVSYWKVNDPEIYSGDRLPFVLLYNDGLLQGTFPAVDYRDMIKFATTYGKECDPNDREFGASPEEDWRATKASEFTEAVHVGVHKKPEFTETCLYTMTPDDGFIIDHVPTNRNILIGCGFSGHGFKLAPVVGKMLAHFTAEGRHLYSDEIVKHFKLNRFDV